MNVMMPDAQFSVSLTTAAHAQAEARSHAQLNPQRAKQSYLNGLALYAVEFYTDCLGLDPDRSTSLSHDPLQMQLAPVSDLVIPNWGRLECCALLPGAQKLQVTPDAWSDRIAYIAVQLDPTLQQAHLLGFIPEVRSRQGQTPVSVLNEMAQFGKYLHNLKAPAPLPGMQLEKWFRHQFRHHFEANWQALEQNLLSPPANTALAFRNLVTAAGKKTISLGPEASKLELEIILQLTQKSDHRLRIEAQLQSHRANLPPGLMMTVLDDQNQTFLSLLAKQGEKLLQAPAFLGQPGEQFSLAIRWGNHCVTEKFQV